MERRYGQDRQYGQDHQNHRDHRDRLEQGLSNPPPRSEEELRARAYSIAAYTLAELAHALGQHVPADNLAAKGWVGRLVETALGATSHSRAGPDFASFGVELKTIPVDRLGRPKESTFVSTVPLTLLHEECWETSTLRQKLQRVLFVPIEAEATIPIPERRIGQPLLWSPSTEEAALLRTDWEEFADLIAEGYVESITAHRGKVLQIRPKGQNASARRWGRDDQGDPFRTRPKGFYLRAAFTRRILERSFILPYPPLKKR